MLGEGFDPAGVSYKIEAGIGLRDDLTKNVFIEIDDGGMITPSSAIEAAQRVFNSAGIAGDGLGSFVWESVRLTAVAATPHAPLSGGRVETEVDALPKDSSTMRKVWNGTGFTDTRVFEFSTLEPGELIIGPAMIDCEFTTIFVSDVREAWVDSTRNVVMKRTSATKREDGND
jgi:N-methylhydantoinase A/oxoprolinase/acetone carboxylase beta subunit